MPTLFSRLQIFIRYNLSRGSIRRRETCATTGGATDDHRGNRKEEIDANENPKSVAHGITGYLLNGRTGLR